MMDAVHLAPQALPGEMKFHRAADVDRVLHRGALVAAIEGNPDSTPIPCSQCRNGVCRVIWLSMKPIVYIETTIVGHLTTRLPNDLLVASQMLATRKWWAESRQHFDICTSDLVLNEASRGDSEAAAERIAAIREVPLVPIPDTAGVLAQMLISQGALPRKAEIDALHLAIAATNAIEYLLTWNCRHLANATLRVKINQICREQGYEPPIICTPHELDEVKS
jgi:hypothetical protein